MSIDAEHKVSTGQAIRYLRKQANMTQSQLAKHAGVDGATVSIWERGLGGLRIETAWRLADLFDVTIDALVGRS